MVGRMRNSSHIFWLIVMIFVMTIADRIWGDGPDDTDYLATIILGSAYFICRAVEQLKNG